MSRISTGVATVAVVVATIVSCGPKATPVSPAGVASVDEFCSTLPAERPALLVELAPPAVLEWLSTQPETPHDPVGVRARVEWALASWAALNVPPRAGLVGPGGLAAFLQLVEAAYVVELLHREDPGEPDAATAGMLERIYHALSLPRILADIIAQMLDEVMQEVLDAAEEQEGEIGADLLRGQRDLLRVLPDRARALHRYAAGILVCRAGDARPEAVEALRHLAEAAFKTGASGEAVAFRREVVRRAPEEPEDHWELARAAYRALDPELGDRAIADADVRCGVACPDRPSDLGKMADAARAILAIGEPDDAEERLAAGAAHETLRNHSAAMTLYEDAAADLPDDARPMTGAARVVMRESADAARALVLLEAAGPENRDGDYWQLLVGTCMGMMWPLGPRIMHDPASAPALLGAPLGRLRSAVQGWAPFEPGRAAALLLLLDAAGRALERGLADVDAALREAATGFTARAMELARAYPDEADVAQVLTVAVLFAESPDQAMHALARPLPELFAADPVLLGRRASVALAAAVRWRDPAFLAHAGAAAEAIAADRAPLGALRRMFEADRAAAAWRLGAAGVDASAVRDAYLAVVEDPALPAGERARVLNNLGVALFATGDAGAAAERWRRAEDLADRNSDVPRYNRLASAALVAELPQDAIDSIDSYMRRTTSREEDAHLRRQAHLWIAWIARRRGDEAAARAAEAEADSLASVLLSDPASSDLGLMTRGSLELGLGTPSGDKLVFDFHVSARVWLLLPAPR